MKISKEKILFFSCIIISLLLIELSLRILSINLPARDLKSPLYNEYSIEELDSSIPFRHKNHGGECIKPRFIKKCSGTLDLASMIKILILIVWNNFLVKEKPM